MLLGALPAAAALLAAACSSEPGSPGPLGGPGDPATQCMPAAKGQAVVMGLYALQNFSKTTPVTLRSVTFTKTRGVEFTTPPWVIPLVYPKNGGDEVVGAGFPYPPETWPTWKDRRAAVGAVIRPGRVLNLVFGIARTTAQSGTSDGPTVTYTAGGNHYTWHGSTSIVVTAKKSC